MYLYIYIYIAVGTPVKYSATSATELAQLSAAVNAISANGGGDCPELGMAGILNGLSLSSQGGSVIVLTDASAKDASRTDEVIQAAFELGACVHFIFTRTGCGTDFLNYRRVAEATNGFQINDLAGFAELANITQVTGARLCGNDDIIQDFNASVGTGGCASVEVSCLTESLTFSLNPARGSSARITIQDPDGVVVFDQTLTSLNIFNVPGTSFKDGSWIVCILSGEAEIRQTQDIRFDVAVEHIIYDEDEDVYYTAKNPPVTTAEVPVLVFSEHLDDLSETEPATLKAIAINGSVIMEIPITRCGSYFEGRYFLPTVEYKFVFCGVDKKGRAFTIDLDTTYPAGPEGGDCMHESYIWTTLF